jgi:hypothetical protein
MSEAGELGKGTAATDYAKEIGKSYKGPARDIQAFIDEALLAKANGGAMPDVNRLRNAAGFVADAGEAAREATKTPVNSTAADLLAKQKRYLEAQVKLDPAEGLGLSQRAKLVRHLLPEVTIPEEVGGFSVPKILAGKKPLGRNYESEFLLAPAEARGMYRRNAATPLGAVSTFGAPLVGMAIPNLIEAWARNAPGMHY